MGNPEMPPPPPALPPINAKLIFVDRTNLIIQPKTAQPEVDDQLMQEDGEEVAVQTGKLEVPSDLPPGEERLFIFNNFGHWVFLKNDLCKVLWLNMASLYSDECTIFRLFWP